MGVFRARGLALVVVALWAGSALAEEADVRDRIVLLNKAALDDYDALEWESAKKKLLDALVLAKKNGLENHPLTARTYVHLGLVYINGFKNRDKALQSFLRAFEIQPDVRMSRGMATAEVNDIFAEAEDRARQARRPAARRDDFGEPDRPVRVNALDCPITDTTRADEAVPVRCAVAPNLSVTKVFLLFRDPAKQRFTEVEMKRTPKGWFQGRIPERVIYGSSVQLYFEGRNAAGKPIVRNGEETSPNLILIVKR